MNPSCLKHLLTIILLTAASCSSVRATYSQAGYSATESASIKHIAVRAWSPASHPDLSPVLSLIGFRMVNQYKNYLVHAHGPIRVGWAEACADLQGVLVIRTLDVTTLPESTTLDLQAELYRCSDGALLWRAEGASELDPADEDLTLLVKSITSDLGGSAHPYAAAAFALLQQLLESMPDPPPLTEDEIEQRIELEIELG